MWSPLSKLCMKANEITEDIAVAKAKGYIMKNPNVLKERTKLGSTALHLAVLGRTPAIVSLLVDNGCSIDSVNRNLETPLHWACKEGDLSIVKVLVILNAYLDSTDVEGNTPLHWATEEGNMDIAQFLLLSGASKKIKNAKGKTPRGLQEAKNNKYLTKLLK